MLQSNQLIEACALLRSDAEDHMPSIVVVALMSAQLLAL
jgi:hypothetical protein